MPDRISPAQLRAARAMVDWSMLDLAKAAKLSISTVKRFERDGHQLVSAEAIAMMRDALETEQVRFLPDDGNGPGVRCRRR
nr:helix-turn-helix domain-containing protein [Lichenibacterium sp. 6Y81]